jgi:hypothetical protein
MIVQCDFIGNWNHEDCDHALQLATNTIERTSTSKEMVLIFNMEAMNTPSVNVLDFIGSLLETQAARLAMFVVVSTDLLLTSMLQLNTAFYEYFGVQLIVADTFTEAQKLLAQWRAPLGH